MYDVIIIGGSYAGLSAAMSLGRSLRKVLIIDSGSPCNQQAPHAHNFLTQDGEKPDVIAAKSKAQALAYETVMYKNGLATEGKRITNGFELLTDDAQKYTAKKLIFATGIKDFMPEIAGFKECWGISVVHCPYCHGYESSKQRTGLLANGEQAYHLAALITNLTNDLAILTNGKADINETHISKLEKHEVSIIDTPIERIIHENGYIKSVAFTNGTQHEFKILYTVIPFSQHCDIPEKIGCEMISPGYIKVDASYQTTIEGVYACGDCTSAGRSIANAVYEGNITGAMVNKALLAEQW